MAALFNMLFFCSLKLSAQQENKNLHFIDYGAMSSNILTNLKKAVQLSSFGSSKQLKEQALSLTAASKAKIPVSIKPDLKILKGTEIG